MSVTETLPGGWSGSILDPSDPERKRVLFNFLPKKLDDGGIVVAAQANVKLSLAQKHLVTFRAGTEDAWFISADGFRHLNRVAGVSVLFPPRVELPGVGVVSNPYVDPTRKRGHFRGWARAIGVYRNLFGEVVLIDRPTELDLEAYLLEDLAAKAEWCPSAITWGSADVNPADTVEAAVAERNADLLSRAEAWERKNPDKGESYQRKDILEGDKLAATLENIRRGVQRRLWKFFPLLGDDVGIWVDMTSGTVRRVFRTLVSKWKFGERILSTIAWRNVMRDALGVYTLDPRRVNTQVEGKGREAKVVDATTQVPVSVFRTEWDERRIQRLMADYMSGVRTALLSGAIVDVKEMGHEAMDPELHGRAALLEERGESSQVRRVLEMVTDQEAEGEEGEEPGPAVLPDRAKLLLDIRKAEEAVSVDAVDAAREKVFGEVLVNFGDEAETPPEKLASYLRSLKARARAAEKKEGEAQAPEGGAAEPGGAAQFLQDLGEGAEFNPDDIPF